MLAILAMLLLFGLALAGSAAAALSSGDLRALQAVMDTPCVGRDMCWKSAIATGGGSYDKPCSSSCVICRDDRVVGINVAYYGLVRSPPSSPCPPTEPPSRRYRYCNR